MLWKTTLDTAATDTAEDVAIDPAGGGLVVVGRTSGAFPTFANQGQFDLFLALLDPTSGQPSTIFQTGNERPQHPARLSLGPGGQVVVGGWDDTYIPTNYVAANQDGFFASFSIDPGPGHAVGQTSWLYTYSPSATAPFSNANGVAAEQDGSGASYVVTTVSANPSVSGIFVTKLRGDHTTAWTARISDSPFDALTAVALSPAGELYVTGGTFLTLGAKAFGQEDAFVMKLDKETGAPLWTGQAGGADSDYPTALAVDAQGNVAIAGYTLGSVVDGVANQGGGRHLRPEVVPERRSGLGLAKGNACRRCHYQHGGSTTAATSSSAASRAARWSPARRTRAAKTCSSCGSVSDRAVRRVGGSRGTRRGWSP